MTYVKYASIDDFKDFPAPEQTDGDKRCTLFDSPQREITDLDEKSENMYTRTQQAHDIEVKAVGSYLHEMQHDEDPKELILKKIGNTDGIRLSGAQVLVATYIRPERKKSGIILTQKLREEDQFQGKCGLVIKLGPLAYKENDKLDFGGYKVKVGDWVFYRPVDGYALSVNSQHCRVLDDVEIKGDLEHPDMIL